MMGTTQVSDLPPVAPVQVSRGLQLWLELRDPLDLPRLMGEIAARQKHTRAALLQQGNVHFARFLPSRLPSPAPNPTGSGTDRVALQVITEFDGDLDAYATDFIFTIGDVFDLILHYVDGGPRTPVRDHPEEFLEFIRRNNKVPVPGLATPIEPSIFSAYPDQTVLDLLGNSKETTIPFASAADQHIDFDDVQANILRGVHYCTARYLSLHIPDASDGKAFLTRLRTGADNTPTVSNAAYRKAKPAYLLNLGLTYSGLVQLGLAQPEKTRLETYFKAFVEGPAHTLRALRNGDLLSSHPDTWILGGPRHGVHLVLSLHAQDAATLNATHRALESSWRACGLELRHQQDAQALGNDKVHFGYRDGISQPRLAVENLYGGTTPASELQPAIGVGTVLLGADYTNNFGGKGSLGGLSAAWAGNGAFAALRVLRQDVVAFERLLDQGVNAYGHLPGVTREWIAARLVGRWRDGEPTALSSNLATPAAGAGNRNDFDYAPSNLDPGAFDDHLGQRCPIGAHIRRMNPRSSRVAGMPHSRRVIRRGMPFGSAYDPETRDNPLEERGLVGLFLCADLERQFEFLLQTWANADFAASGLRGMQDPIIGAQYPTGGAPMNAEFRCLAPDGVTDIRLPIPRLVDTVGSLYLFMPGLAGIDHLAQATPTAPAATRTAAMKQVEVPAKASVAAGFDPAIFDPLEKSFVANPYPTYQKIHNDIRPAVAHIPHMHSVWVFGRDLVMSICQQPELFRKREDASIRPTGILTMDPPAHTTMRGHIDPLFVQAIQLARKDSSDIASALIASLRPGPVDWIGQFARPLSQRLFARVLGLDETRIADLMINVDRVLSAHNPGYTSSASQDFADGLKKLGIWFTLAGDRTQDRPGTTKPPFLRRTQALPLVDVAANTSRIDEFAANAATLALSGFKPLEWLIGLVTLHLLQDNARLLQQLKALQRQGTLNHNLVVNELVRFDSPLPMANRYYCSDKPYDLGRGVELKNNDRLTLVYGAANRDPGIANADTVDFGRKPGQGIGFGHGPRECLGYALAHEVLAVVIDSLIAMPRTPALAGGLVPQYGSNPYFRFLHHLPVVV